MSEHTPGPWQTHQMPDGRWLICTGEINVAGTAHEGFGPCDDKIEEANARLIAAAPETAAERDRLREALEDLEKAASWLEENYESDRRELVTRTRYLVARLPKARAALDGTAPSEAERLRALNGELVKALERTEGELRYMAEKMPYTNARAALKTVSAALAKAQEDQP